MVHAPPSCLSWSAIISQMALLKPTSDVLSMHLSFQCQLCMWLSQMLPLLMGTGALSVHVQGNRVNEGWMPTERDSINFGISVCVRILHAFSGNTPCTVSGTVHWWCNSKPIVYQYSSPLHQTPPARHPFINPSVSLDWSCVNFQSPSNAHSMSLVLFPPPVCVLQKLEVGKTWEWVY